MLGTPRRLVVSVEDLAAAPARPRARWSRARRPAAPSMPLGSPPRPPRVLPAARGLEVSDLEVREMDGGQYVVAVVQETGRPALEVLAEALPGWIAGAQVRQIHALERQQCGLLAPHPLAAGAVRRAGRARSKYAGLRSGSVTRGLRFREPGRFRSAQPGGLFRGFLEVAGHPARPGRAPPGDRRAGRSA